MKLWKTIMVGFSFIMIAFVVYAAGLYVDGGDDLIVRGGGDIIITDGDISAGGGGLVYSDATNQTTINEAVITTTLDTPTINTGHGDVEAYAMNQDLETTDSPTFESPTINGDIDMTNGNLDDVASIDGGGDSIYVMDHLWVYRNSIFIENDLNVPTANISGLPYGLAIKMETGDRSEVNASRLIILPHKDAGNGLYGSELLLAHRDGDPYTPYGSGLRTYQGGDARKSNLEIFTSSIGEERETRILLTDTGNLYLPELAAPAGQTCDLYIDENGLVGKRNCI